MKVLIYSTRDFKLEVLKKVNRGRHKIPFVSEALDSTTAVLAAMLSLNEQFIFSPIPTEQQIKKYSPNQNGENGQ